MTARLRGTRWLTTCALALVVVLSGPGTALAVPPPPPNPSDSELEESREEEQERAGEVGRLSNQLAEAEQRLTELETDVAVHRELANKARVDAENAEAAAIAAQEDAEAADAMSTAAGEAVEQAREQSDEFVAGSYRQGNQPASLTAYFGAGSPQDVLERAQLLDAVGERQGDAVAQLQRARVEKSNADAAAREAVELAEQAEREAQQARQQADAAHDAAVQASVDQQARTSELTTERDAVERELYDAQQRVAGLEDQRQQFEQWQEEKRLEEERKAREAAEAAAAAAAASKPQPSNNSAPQPPSNPASGVTVETVISRAMSQLGLPYAWGGGNTQGPTYGIRDGGVADSYGDYRKIGFDCSGLMIYAFAPVKTLPHYSGYQYNSGRRVPLSEMRRGDMLFWGTSRIHHVALYLGNGQMIEAPQSGSYVKVSPVRYGDILPYAVRLIG